MPDKRIIQHVDWWLLLSLLLIMGLGFINLNSASIATGYPFQWKQLQWYSAGLVLMAVMILFDYRVLLRYAVHIYSLVLALLVLVLVVGKTVGGSQRWLPLGFFNLQPSEFAKLAIVILVARIIALDRKESYAFRDLLRLAALLFPPVILINLQPDLGTSLLLIAIAGSMILLATIRWTTVVTIACVCVGGLPLVWKFLKPYQRRRIEIFLNPENDPLGSGYHVIQSKIAVGSGQVFGKGYGKGTQAHLDFLPEVHTDFAFSIWAEEWGFVGAVILVILFAVLLWRCVSIAASTRERFGTFLVFGSAAMIFWQVFINTCMVTGLMPVVGIPFPFISYGGSSVLTACMGLGLVLNVRARRFLFP